MMELRVEEWPESLEKWGARTTMKRREGQEKNTDYYDGVIGKCSVSE
jgi:hypothetical protein